jgi:hypothetical protein
MDMHKDMDMRKDKHMAAGNSLPEAARWRRYPYTHNMPIHKPARQRRSNCRRDSRSGLRPVVGNNDQDRAAAAHLNRAHWGAWQFQLVEQGLLHPPTAKRLRSRQFFELETF